MDIKSNEDSAGSDSLDKSLQQKCVVVDDSKHTSVEVGNPSATEQEEEPENCILQALQAELSASLTIQNTSNDLGSSSSSSASTLFTKHHHQINTNEASSSSSSSNESKAESCTSSLERKVRQISRELKETSLDQIDLEPDNTENTLMSSPNFSDQTVLNKSGATEQSDEDIDVELPASGGRLKRVRFHPNAKENDGGNRVKKRRLNQNCGSQELTEPTTNGEAEVEEYDLAKAIADAKTYLKAHPLSFASGSEPEESNDATTPQLTNNANTADLETDHEMEDLEEENSFEDIDEEDDDLFTNVLPENGVHKILGKQTKCGKVEFLIVYADMPGLHWETKEVLENRCPKLLLLYDRNRERLQQKLMAHIAKRQKLRQRYADF